MKPICAAELARRIDHLPSSTHGVWPAQDSEDERTLLYYACAMYAQNSAVGFEAPLRAYLGIDTYNYFFMSIAYNRTALGWAEANPELPWAQDQRVRAHLGRLVATEPRLALYFAGAAAATALGPTSPTPMPSDSDLQSADAEVEHKTRHASAQHNVFLQAILDCTAHGIWGVDLTGSLTFINAQALTLLGYEPNTNLIGQDPHLLFRRSAEASPITAPSESSAPCARLWDEDIQLHRETFWRTDGTSFIGELRSKPIIVQGTRTGSVVAIMDVTTEALAEQKALAHKRELAQVNESLRQEHDLRDHFVATLTHDLRTPIASAKMVAQLLQRKLVADPTAAKKMGRIIADMNRANRMIENLLDASRIKAGDGVALQIGASRIDKLVAEVVADANAHYGERFVLTNVAGPMPGYCDAMALQRVLENLLTNAVKYGIQNAPITTHLKRDGLWLHLSVHNAGNPIAPQHQATLFDAFRRTPSAQASEQKGWGLGLTLVKGIAQAHGGEAFVHSTLAAGTTFALRLPIDSRPHAC